MAKVSNKTTPRDTEKATIIKIVAGTYGVSARAVYRIVKGERKNKAILTTHEELKNILQMSRQRIAEKALIVKKLSEMYELSKRQIYRIINGDQENEAVLNSYMYMQEGIDGLSSQLLDAVKKLVPIN